MKLPPINDRHLAALRSSLRLFPDKKLPILSPRRGPSRRYERLELDPSIRRASVFVPLCNRHSVPSILFTVRTQNVGSHKGHVSFPGGHREKHETPQEAALRELREELFGMESVSSAQDADIVGECEHIEALTGTLVSPVIGFLNKDVGDLSMFSPDTNEVDHVFTRSIEDLLSPSSRTINEFTHKGVSMKLPQWGENKDQQKIWGLTACILESVLDTLIMPLIEKGKS